MKTLIPAKLFLAPVFLILCSAASTLGAPTTVAPTTDPEPKLSLVIACTTLGIKVGDEIPITFTIRNDGDTPYKYFDRNYDRGGRMGEYGLTATDSDGVPVADPRAVSKSPSFGGGLGNNKFLAPGESFSKTILLNEWVLAKKPGIYRVTGIHEGGFPIAIAWRTTTSLTGGIAAGNSLGEPSHQIAVFSKNLANMTIQTSGFARRHQPSV